MPSVETLVATCISESGHGCASTPDEDSMLTITSFTGGLVTSLDYLKTTNRRLNSVLTIQPNGPTEPLVRVQLVETLAAASPGVRIYPLDRIVATNPRAWEVVG